MDKRKSGFMSWILAILIVVIVTTILIFLVVNQNIKDVKGEGLKNIGYSTMGGLNEINGAPQAVCGLCQHYTGNMTCAAFPPQ